MNRPAGRIVCLGDVMIDVLALLPGPVAIGSDVPAPISFSHGGSAANTAAWLAKLGAPSVFTGRVGDDEFGRAASEQLRQQGVTTRISIDPAVPTGVCLVLIGPDGQRSMVPSAGANATLGAAEPGLLAPTDWLHLSGYSLLNAGSRTAARCALEVAAELGCPVSVDAASAEPIRRLGAGQFLAWLPSGTLLLANVDELNALTGEEFDGEAGVAGLVGCGLTLVIKDGPRGAVLASSEGTQRLPTEPAAVLDSTGAGDAFAAGLLATLWDGAALPDAVAAGNRVGALALSQLGGRPPTGDLRQ